MVDSAMRKMGHAIKTSLVAGFTLGSAAIIKFGADAISASLEFQRFEATIGGALGSLDRGKSVMAALSDYALKSAFDLSTLAEAATQMVAAGLNLEQVLPMAERFALIIGGTDPQGLMQVAGALARIKGGSFGEAMEIFRRAGVSANDLRAQGIDITKGGEIRGTPTQVMAAIERISEGRPKAMADAISQTDSVTVSNLRDVFGKSLRVVGDEILGGLVPTLKKWTSTLDELISSGYLDSLGSAFKDVFIAIGGSDGRSALIAAVSLMTGALQSAAATIRVLFPEQLGGPRQMSVEDFTPFTGNDFGSQVLGSLLAPGSIFRAEAFVAEMGAPLEQASLLKFGQKKASGSLDTSEPGDNTNAIIGGKATSYLAQIAENTKLTKQDLRRLAFGAGASEAGVTAVEMSRAKRRRSSGDLGGEIGNLIEDYFNQQFHAWIKQQGYAR